MKKPAVYFKHAFPSFTFVGVNSPDELNKKDKEKIHEFIYRRRKQLIINSIIYYRLNDNIISDDLWQKFANELYEVQTQYPDCINIGFLDDLFSTWDGDTGMHLVLIEFLPQAIAILNYHHSINKELVK